MFVILVKPIKNVEKVGFSWRRKKSEKWKKEKKWNIKKKHVPFFWRFLKKAYKKIKKGKNGSKKKERKCMKIIWKYFLAKGKYMKKKKNMEVKKSMKKKKKYRLDTFKNPPQKSKFSSNLGGGGS